MIVGNVSNCDHSKNWKKSHNSVILQLKQGIQSKMQEIELPCSWNVDRRPNAAHYGPKNCDKTGENGNNNNMNQKKLFKKQDEEAEESTHVVSNEENCVIPKSSFRDAHPNEEADNFMTTTLQRSRGLIKQKILNHLQPIMEPESEPHNKEMCHPANLNKKRKRSKNIENSTLAVQYDEQTLDTDSLISRLPYKKMLSDMFGGNLKGHLNTVPIPYVSKAYEEAFMREPLNSSERECAKGKACECMFIDRTQPFVGVEFLLPGEQPPRTPHLCVVCCRATTQQLYYDVMFDKCDFPGTIQRYGNIHSEPGEYSLDAMLISAPTAPVHIMPLPIVSHQRNRYSVFVHGGVKRLKQNRVYFQCTPSQ